MQPTRMIWPQNRLGPKPRVIPIWSCSRWGLPCRPCCQVRGALLPHPFTLTPACRGGLLSVALSLRSPSPAVSRHRVSKEPGLSSGRQLPTCQRSPGQLAGRCRGTWQPASRAGLIGSLTIAGAGWPQIGVVAMRKLLIALAAFSVIAPAASFLMRKPRIRKGRAKRWSGYARCIWSKRRSARKSLLAKASGTTG